MRKHAWILTAALLLSACSPQVYPLYLDVRHPSASGIDLSGKNIALVYMDGTSAADSLFDRQASSALARSLEEDYFGGSEVIELYHIPVSDSVSLEQMHSLVMDTGGDVVFVLSSHLGSPVPDVNQAVSVPLKTQLFVYDSMGEDKVHSFRGSAVLRAQEAQGLSGMESLAEEVGSRVAERFLSTWMTESFSFYYLEDAYARQWLTALQCLQEQRFAAAVDLWAPLVKNGNPRSQACACYNIAQAFYLMGDYGIAQSWLDEAEKLENLGLAQGLRKRLAKRLQK